MKRRIFNILAAISLLLFLATAVLWVRSYWRSDSMNWTSSVDGQLRQTMLAARSESGVLGCWHGDFRYSRGRGALPFSPVRRTRSGPFPPGWQTYSGRARAHAVLSEFLRFSHVYFLGFGYAPQHRRVDTEGVVRGTWDFFLPHWFACLLLAIAPVRWLVLKRREICNRLPHRCKTCGYDLRATPDPDGPLLERCPECGSEAHLSPPSR